MNKASVVGFFCSLASLSLMSASVSVFAADNKYFSSDYSRSQSPTPAIHLAYGQGAAYDCYMRCSNSLTSCLENANASGREGVRQANKCYDRLAACKKSCPRPSAEPAEGPRKGSPR